MSEFILGDCMEYLPKYEDNHFDLAIVDPPYGIGDVRQMNKKRKRLHNGFSWNDSAPNEKYFTELTRVSKNRIIWGCNYYAKYIPDYGRIIHDKVGSGASQLHELSDCDLASHSFGVNIKKFEYIWRGNVQGNTINWDNSGADSRIHPTQKPIALYKWLLHNYANNGGAFKGDLILSTHVGSASDLIACEDMGFEYVGYELDKDYYEAASKRLANHKAQLKIFN